MLLKAFFHDNPETWQLLMSKAPLDMELHREHQESAVDILSYGHMCQSIKTYRVS